MKKKSPQRGKGKDTGAVSPPGARRPPSRRSRKERVIAATTGAIQAKIDDRAANYTDKGRETYIRAMRGVSRKDAMTAFCTMCMGYQSEEVKRCTDPACPLYPYRR